MDVTKLCRGCMKEVASWEKENFDPRAVEMFCFCTNIRITEEDRLPKQFCYDCIIKMESSYTFITEAQKVNVTLKNIISRTNTVIVEPETSIKNLNLIIDNNIKLTLPDYKICSVIENDTRQLLDPIQKPTIEVDNNGHLDDNFALHDDTEAACNEKVVEPKKEMEKEVKSNVCLVCRKSFTSKTWYEKHMQKEHSGQKYVCAHCPKSFSRASQLATHSVSHSDERKFSCTTCGKRFKQRKQLAVHTRAHGEARPYTCDKCSARFKTKSILKSHMAVHEKDKPFLCCFCGWSFTQGGNLKVHMRMHTGEKPFSCGSCGFRAAVASNLRRHQRTHAAADPPHPCTRCGKAFNDRSNLVRHLRTHTGEVPYRCPRCAASFSDSWKRKTHLMRAHKLALHDIPRMRTDGRLLHYTSG